MGEHTVSSFDEELNALEELIIAMEKLSDEMVRQAVNALMTADKDLAQKVIGDDKMMDDMQRDLDERAIMLIAKRQPMAQDLRMVVGTMRMAGDLERIGDLAKNIAKRVKAIDSATMTMDFSKGIEQMAELARSQINQLVKLYIGRKPEGFGELRERDEEIDLAYNSVFHELLRCMMDDPAKVTSCTHLLFCAKNLERIGDHVTNIAENAFFMMTGEQLPIERSKADTTIIANS